jgi:hypothetical protein
MIPRILAVLGVVLSAMTHMHLSLTLLGLTLTVAVPWVIVTALVAVPLIVLWIVWRNVRGFKSSPYPRPRFAT